MSKYEIVEGVDGKFYVGYAGTDSLVDWPALDTRAEAEQAIKEFRKADRESAADEASERKWLHRMSYGKDEE